MNPTSKKFIALFLAFSLMAISCTTMTTQRQKRFESSKERKHGAKLIVTKKNGGQISGELITVKPSSLLLLNTEGKDVSIDVADIEVIRIVKKSKALGGIAGFLVGAGLGALVGHLSLYEFLEGYNPKRDGSKVVQGAMIGGCIGTIPGVLLGGVAGRDKKIQIEGMTDSETKEALEKLRKKARIPDYK